MVVIICEVRRFLGALVHYGGHWLEQCGTVDVIHMMFHRFQDGSSDSHLLISSSLVFCPQ